MDPMSAPPSPHEALRPLLWSNSAAQLGAALAARVSRAAATLAAARLLGPEGFGKLAAALAAYEMLRVVSEAGLDTRLIRRAAQQPDLAAVESTRTALLKIRIAALAIVVALGIAAVAVGVASVALLAVLCVGVIGLAVAGSVQAMATGRLEAPRLLPLQAAAGIVFLVGVAVVSFIWRQPLAAAAAIGVCDLLGGGILLRYVGNPRVRGPEQPAWSARAALREAWPVGAVNVLATAYGRLGLAVLAMTWGSSAVAQYGVSYRTVEVFLLAAGAVAGSALAVTARLDAPDARDARALLDHLIGRLALITLATAGLVAAGATFLPALLGARYAPAVGTTRVLAFALPPMFVNGLLTAHLYGRGRYHTVLRIALGNLLLNALLVVLLVPSMGPLGAAFAVAATECVNTAWQSRAIGLRLRSWAYGIAAASLIAATFFLITGS